MAQQRLPQGVVPVRMGPANRTDHDPDQLIIRPLHTRLPGQARSLGCLDIPARGLAVPPRPGRHTVRRPTPSSQPRRTRPTSTIPTCRYATAVDLHVFGHHVSIKRANRRPTRRDAPDGPITGNLVVRETGRNRSDRSQIHGRDNIDGDRDNRTSDWGKHAQTQRSPGGRQEHLAATNAQILKGRIG